MKKEEENDKEEMQCEAKGKQRGVNGMQKY